MVYLYALTDAVLAVVRARNSGRSQRKNSTSHLMETFLPCHLGNDLTAVPVKKADTIKEFWSLLSDKESWVTCDICDVEVDLNFYVCPVCVEYYCHDCERALSTLTLRERVAEFGRLRRSRSEVIAVLNALAPIKSRDACLIAKVLAQGPFLGLWISQKNEDYQNWRASRTVYDHFKRQTMIDWKIIHTLTSIKSVFASRDGEAEAISSAAGGAKQLDDIERDLREVSDKWREVSVLNKVGEDFRAVCVHQCQTYLKKPSLDGDAALDSSGAISPEFFQFLADKYEAAANTETGIMRRLEPQDLPSDYDGRSGVQRPGFVPSELLLEHSTAPRKNAEGDFVEHANSQMERHTIVDPDNCLSTNCALGISAPGNTSPGSSEAVFPTRSLEDESGVEIDVEDFLGYLLAKRSSLARDGGLTEKDDLVLNTAWNMAQAIVYRCTPRPSLEEISDKGYWTAPTTPLLFDGTGHSNGAPSSYSTPRPMSPVQFVLDVQ